MDSKPQNKPVAGVIGSGSFGTAISNLLAENGEVLMYSRREEVVQRILETRENSKQKVNERVIPTTDIERITRECTLIFPLVPSKNFRSMMRSLAPLLSPRHVLIHGTKGLDVDFPENSEPGISLTREQVKTMSEVMLEESGVPRVGVLAGPNLAREISQGLPAGTVIGSRFDEVIRVGKKAIGSARFRVYGNHDLLGVELGGVLKNILAIGSGIVSGLDLGENARALMITRGWGELIRVASIFGSDRSAFMGLAGIGDLIATCSSPLSRNYTLGYRLAKGETIQEIIDTMEEVAEGYNTVRIAYGLVQETNVYAPLIRMFFDILYRGRPLKDGIYELMSSPTKADVDFL